MTMRKCPTCRRILAVPPPSKPGLRSIAETVAVAYGLTVEAMLNASTHTPFVVEARRTALVIGFWRHPEVKVRDLVEAFGYRRESKRLIYECLRRSAELPMLTELMGAA